MSEITKYLDDNAQILKQYSRTGPITNIDIFLEINQEATKTAAVMVWEALKWEQININSKDELVFQTTHYLKW